MNQVATVLHHLAVGPGMRSCTVKKISNRFALMMAAASGIPAAVCMGRFSVYSLARSATGCHRGNLGVARRVAEQIELYVTGSVKI
jgi:hypothetical protein